MIGRLASLLPPPASPPPRPDWRRVEGLLGTPLPPDYRALAETCGAGRIASFLWVFAPDASHGTIDLLAQASAQRQVLEERRAGGEPFPFQAFPAPGGLLAAGMSDNGDAIWWRTADGLRGDPAAWTIIVQEARGPGFHAHDASLTDFLAGVLDGSVRCSVFPAGIRSAPATFEPVWADA